MAVGNASSWQTARSSDIGIGLPGAICALLVRSSAVAPVAAAAAFVTQG